MRRWKGVSKLRHTHDSQGYIPRTEVRSAPRQPPPQDGEYATTQSDIVSGLYSSAPFQMHGHFRRSHSHLWRGHSHLWRRGSSEGRYARVQPNWLDPLRERNESICISTRVILSSQPKTLVLRGVTVQALKVASQPQGGIIAARWQTVASLSKPTRFKGEEGFVLFCSDPYFGVEQALLCPGERPSHTPALLLWFPPL